MLQWQSTPINYKLKLPKLQAYSFLNSLTYEALFTFTAVPRRFPAVMVTGTIVYAWVWETDVFIKLTVQTRKRVLTLTDVTCTQNITYCFVINFFHKQEPPNNLPFE